MLDINAIANMMEKRVKDCEKCPIEEICDEFDDDFDCASVWEAFLRTQVEDDDFGMRLVRILQQMGN